MSYHLGQIDPEERTGLYADPRDEEADPPPRRVLRIVGALLVMALFAGGLWFAYVEGARHAAGTGGSGDIPLIRADTRPMKVKPAEPGGMPIPDRDMLIYGQNRPIGRASVAAARTADGAAGAAAAAAKPAVSASADAATNAARRPRSRQAPTRLPRSQLPGRNSQPACRRQIRIRCPRNRRKRRPNQEQREGCGFSSARCAVRGMRARNGLASSAATRICSATHGDGGSRRSRRQGRLLPYPGGAGRRPGDRRTALRRAEAAPSGVHHRQMNCRQRQTYPSTTPI